MSLPPSEIPLGAMRFNSDSQKLEYWNGTAWFQIHLYAPTFDGGSGRGMFAGGAFYNTIERITISTQGNAVDHGDLTTNKSNTSATASRTRGLLMGGSNPQLSPDTFTNTMDFWSISSEGNASDFGDLTSKASYLACTGNQTRAVRLGGTGPSPRQNIMDFVEIATTGDAVDFGDAFNGGGGLSGVNNSVRAINCGNLYPTNGYNKLETFNIPTKGNGVFFGNLAQPNNWEQFSGGGNSIRGFFAGGYIYPSGQTNLIEFINIASLGNSQEFGDLSSAKSLGDSGASNSTRIVFGGGLDPAGLNTMEYLNIATQGNVVDFGDLTQARSRRPGVVSNSHGGLG